MPPHLIRRTWVGALVGAALFGLVPYIRLLASGQSLTGLTQPLLWFAFLGGIIGGLAGPLLGEAWSRSRRSGRGSGGS